MFYEIYSYMFFLKKEASPIEWSLAMKVSDLKINPNILSDCKYHQYLIQLVLRKYPEFESRFIFQNCSRLMPDDSFEWTYSDNIDHLINESVCTIEDLLDRMSTVVAINLKQLEKNNSLFIYSIELECEKKRVYLSTTILDEEIPQNFTYTAFVTLKYISGDIIKLTLVQKLLDLQSQFKESPLLLNTKINSSDNGQYDVEFFYDNDHHDNKLIFIEMINNPFVCWLHNNQFEISHEEFQDGPGLSWVRKKLKFKQVSMSSQWN